MVDELPKPIADRLDKLMDITTRRGHHLNAASDGSHVEGGRASSLGNKLSYMLFPPAPSVVVFT